MKIHYKVGNLIDAKIWHKLLKTIDSNTYRNILILVNKTTLDVNTRIFPGLGFHAQNNIDL